MSETMIKVEHLVKEYQLGVIGGTTLRDELQRLGAKMKHKDDPTSNVIYGRQEKKRLVALRDISFRVQKGEVLGIIGHNGAGKSTLLKVLSRVTAPTQGSVAYNGRITSMLEVGTGFHAELTGRENVYLNGAILGMTKKEISSKFDAIVSFAEMERFIDTPVKRYSSGMYVKLAFAIAAHLDAEIMILDEVLAVGDMRFQEKALSKMDDVSNQTGRTLLYVSHNMSTIRKLCSRVIVLDQGAVLYDGDVETGISLYMKAPSIELNREYNLRNETRISYDGIGFRITHVEFLGNNAPIYQEDTALVMRFSWEATADLSDVYLTLPFYMPDSTVFCMTKPIYLGSPRAGETGSTTISVNLNGLTPSVYYTRIHIFEKNMFGMVRYYDRAWTKLYFRYDIGNIENLEMINNSQFGHVMLEAQQI